METKILSGFIKQPVILSIYNHLYGNINFFTPDYYIIFPAAVYN